MASKLKDFLAPFGATAVTFLHENAPCADASTIKLTASNANTAKRPIRDILQHSGECFKVSRLLLSTRLHFFFFSPITFLFSLFVKRLENFPTYREIILFELSHNLRSAPLSLPLRTFLFFSFLCSPPDSFSSLYSTTPFFRFLFVLFSLARFHWRLHRVPFSLCAYYGHLFSLFFALLRRISASLLLLTRLRILSYLTTNVPARSDAPTAQDYPISLLRFFVWPSFRH